MELVPTVISAGWAAGVNAYGTVAMLGLLGRAGVGEVPDPLTGTPVIVTALVLFAIEFVVDKVAYLDTTWDLVQTPIRPAVGSAVGALFAGDADVSSIDEALSAAGGGGTALASHGLKAGLRLGINASPEPFSNIVVSLLEDGMVAVVVALALEHPSTALAIVIVLMVAGATLAYLIWSRILRAWRAWKGRRRRAPP
ncbi:MAG TPA: DUF4126 domain-containing protein [Solirubrobacterales bacterium]|nr:DUF4126 domain-containing protein [Solirubrobacterales bacterium]